jgi:hypothetical protein
LARMDVLRRLRTHVTRSARIGKRKHLPRGERQHQRKLLGLEGKPVERISVHDPKLLIDTYQANPLAKYLRKRTEYVDRWVKPLPQSLVSTSRLLELVDLVL